MTISSDAPAPPLIWTDGWRRYYVNVSGDLAPAEAEEFARDRIARAISQWDYRGEDTVDPERIAVELAPAPDWPDGPGLSIAVQPGTFTFREAVEVW